MWGRGKLVIILPRDAKANFSCRSSGEISKIPFNFCLAGMDASTSIVRCFAVAIDHHIRWLDISMHHAIHLSGIVSRYDVRVREAARLDESREK